MMKTFKELPGGGPVDRPFATSPFFFFLRALETTAYRLEDAAASVVVEAHLKATGTLGDPTDIPQTH